jgi:Zn-dependent peptidase ImmA (M78 family)
MMPGGFKVKVQVVSKEDESDEIGEQTLACYYHEDHLIQLRSSRSLKQRKTDLEHELQHCCVDWVDHFIRKSRK